MKLVQYACMMHRTAQKLLVVYGTPTSVKKYFPGATGSVLRSGYRPDGAAALSIFRAAITDKTITQPYKFFFNR
jgi:hypothetical protein